MICHFCDIIFTKKMQRVNELHKFPHVKLWVQSLAHNKYLIFIFFYLTNIFIYDIYVYAFLGTGLMQRTKQSNIPTYILVQERDYQKGRSVKCIVQSILIREAW